MAEYWNEDDSTFYSDDEPSASTGNSSSNSIPKSRERDDTNVSEDELDVFMQSVESDLRKEAQDVRKHDDSKKLSEDLDDDNDYLEFLKKKGVDWNSLQNTSNADNSDDDGGKILTDNDEDNDPRHMKTLSLQSVDHDKMEYSPFIKNIYIPHKKTLELSDEDIFMLRSSQNVRVTGRTDVPRPCTNFDLFQFPPSLRQVISFSSPSVIQMHAISIMMGGRDVIALAETGSGKTCAYLFPLLCHVFQNVKQHPLGVGEGPMALILAPTRELCFQIYTDAKKYAPSLHLSAAAVYGGTDKLQQFKALRHGLVHVLCATPGRLMDMIKIKAISLERVTSVVLDEADRMLDFGFGPQVRAILSQTRPDRQTAFFSATFPHKIQKLVDEYLTDPVRITVGRTGQANSSIQQNVVTLTDEVDKHEWLLSRLTSFCAEGNVLIFVASIGRAIDLSTLLLEDGRQVSAIHGMMDQRARDEAVYSFKKGETSVLVATDLASRGLDIKNVRTVIEYDAAHDIDAHVHRIGRTGRTGEKGTAYTLLTQKQDRQAVELLLHLEKMNQTIPESLVELAMKNGKFRNNRPNYKAKRSALSSSATSEPVSGNTQKVTQEAHKKSTQVPTEWRPSKNAVIPNMNSMKSFVSATVSEKKRSRWDIT